MSEVSGVNSSSSPYISSQSINNNIDKNAFLNLLMVQLSNQDPLNPVEDKEFIAQMAQFSSLEQLQQLNENTMLNSQLLLDINDSIATQSDSINEALVNLETSVNDAINALNSKIDNLNSTQSESLDNDIDMINQLINLNKAIDGYGIE